MSINRKFFGIGAIATVLTIPLFIVYLLVWDRSSTANEVRNQIAGGWAAAQWLRGPYLVVPFTEQQVQTIVDKGQARQAIGVRHDALVIAPDDLRASARLRPDKRRRSLFEVVVYAADLTIDARFSAAALRRADIDPSALDWRRAYFVVGIGDPRGFGGSIPRFTIGSRIVEAEPGSRDLALAGGSLNAPAGLAAAPIGELRVATRLSLKGSSSFTVNGNARRLMVDLSSSWRHPSFVGGLLPDQRSVSDRGFAARWSTTYLALNKPLVERASRFERLTNDGAAVAGVALIEPVDLYAQVGRAVKYGVLFIALTFLTFFVYDVTGRRRVPMLAYALVGLGLVLFFLLLLALAEYISLTPAYIVAAAALIGLVTAYSKAVLGGPRRAAVIAGVLTVLYGCLYVLLQLEDYALLLGSVTLFVALAILMYVTRNISTDRDNMRDEFQAGTS